MLFKKTYNEKKYIHILMFLILYVSTETLLFGTSSNDSLLVVGKYFPITLILPFFFYIILYKKRFFTNSLLVVFLFVINILFTILINQEEIRLYIMLVSIIFVAFEFCTLISFDDFKESFCNVMFFLTSISLIVFLIRIIVPQILSFLPTISNYLGYEYKFYLFGAYHIDTSAIRNSSIFRESGVFAIFLCVALLFELFGFQKLSKKRIIVNCFGIVSTFSTTGFFIAPLILLCFILFNTEQKSYIKMLISFFLMVIVVITFLIGDELLDKSDVFGKISEGLSNKSVAARVGSFPANMIFFLQNPLCGKGEYYVGNNFSEVTYKYLGYEVVHNTNTFFSCFSSYGLLFGLIVLIGWFKCIDNFSKNKICSFLLLLIMILLFAGEHLIHCILFFIIIFYGVGKNSEHYFN